MKKSLSYLLFSVWMVLFDWTVCPRETCAQELKFDRIEGLSSSVVTCILQDKRGFMWFGTQTGLNFYDGYTFTVFKNNPVDKNSLSHNYIQCIAEDPDGTIWIGTDDGLNAYDPVTQKFVHYNHNSLGAKVVSALLTDEEGNLWVGTDGGLCFLKKGSHSFKRFLKDESDRESISDNDITALAMDARGYLWVGTKQGGLNRMDRKTGKFMHYFHEEGNKNSLNSNRIRSLLADRQGWLWIGHFGAGLNVMNLLKETIASYSDSGNIAICDNPVTDMIERSDGSIWIATFSGISIYDRKAGRFECVRAEEGYQYGLKKEVIRCLQEDDAGTVWIGTEGGGLHAFFVSKQKLRHYRKGKNGRHSLSDNTVMCFEEMDSRTVWIGTQGGISVWDRETNTFSYILKNGPEKLGHEKIISLLKDSRGTIWAGTLGGGLFARFPGKKEFKAFEKSGGLEQSANSKSVNNSSILCLAEASDGDIWIGGFGGINIYHPHSRSFTYLTRDHGLSDNVIYSLLPGKNGIMWIGTLGGGLNAYDLKTGKITHYSKGEEGRSLSDNSVFCMLQDEKGLLWLGTGNGLSCLNPATGVFTNFYEVHGLPSNVIMGMVQDEEGSLWLSTNDKGIARFTPPSSFDSEIVVRAFDLDDGLQDREFNQGAFARLSDGEILFGGIQGYNAFYPSRLQRNEHKPHVYIRSVNILGKKLMSDTSIIARKYIELDWREAYLISFEVVGLDFVQPSRNMYRVKLEGHESDWRLADHNRFPQYTSVKGGHYVFMAKAANNDGVWNEEAVQLHIYVHPPFWETEWFYALCIISLIAGVFGFIQWRTRQIQHEKKVLEGKVAERTRELAQKNQDITSSIVYAQRIQMAILPSRDQIHEVFKDSFILYRPKDIVSGDFYWFATKDKYSIIAAVDCTGHGVPGAFMSMIGTNLLNQIVLEQGVTRPSDILNKLNEGVQKALQQGRNEVETTDGMDVAVCSFDPEQKIVQFAGAYRPLYYFSQDQFKVLDGNKYPIGGVQMDQARVFTNHKIEMHSGDRIYLFSDGYVDQFGGEKGKKFMTRRFKELLINGANHPMQEQGNLLLQKFEAWKGDEEQIDDVLVIGIRF